MTCQKHRLPYDAPHTTTIAFMHEQFIAASGTDSSALEDMTENPIFDELFISMPSII